MHNPGFDRQNSSRAQNILRKTGADGITLFLFDQENTATTPVSFLYHRQVEPNVLLAYADALYRDDALLPDLSSPKSGVEYFTGTRACPQKANVENSAAKPSAYWHYLSSIGYRETAASFKSISSNLYLVIGLHSVGNKKTIDVDSAGGQLEGWLDETQDYLIEHSVRQTLNRQNPVKPKEAAIDHRALFTRREFQVASELLKGQSNKQIAFALCLSEYAVQNHLRRLYRKFSVRSRTEFITRLHGLNIASSGVDGNL